MPERNRFITVTNQEVIVMMSLQLLLLLAKDYAVNEMHRDDDWFLWLMCNELHQEELL